MKKIIIFIILMGLGIGWVVSAQPVQLPLKEVHIQATVPSGVVDFPPPVITALPGAPEGTPIIQILNKICMKSIQNRVPTKCQNGAMPPPGVKNRPFLRNAL